MSARCRPSVGQHGSSGGQLVVYDAEPVGRGVVLALAVGHAAVVAEVGGESRWHVVVGGAALRVVDHVDGHAAVQHELCHGLAALLYGVALGGHGGRGVVGQHGVPQVGGAAEVGCEGVAAQDGGGILMAALALGGPAVVAHELGHGRGHAACGAAAAHVEGRAQVVVGGVLVPCYVGQERLYGCRGHGRVGLGVGSVLADGLEQCQQGRRRVVGAERAAVAVAHQPLAARDDEAAAPHVVDAEVGASVGRQAVVGLHLGTGQQLGLLPVRQNAVGMGCRQHSAE